MTQDMRPDAASPVPLLTRVRHACAPEPSGCRWCGIGEGEHASRFAPSVGQHRFHPPTPAQRLARMHARRTARGSSIMCG